MKEGSFPLNESQVADDEHFALKRGSPERGSFPLTESQAADEAFCIGERALKKGGFPLNDSKTVHIYWFLVPRQEDLTIQPLWSPREG